EVDDITRAHMDTVIGAVDVIRRIGHAHVAAGPIGTDATDPQRAFGIQPRLPVMTQQGADTVVIGRAIAIDRVAGKVVVGVVIAPATLEEGAEGHMAGSKLPAFLGPQHQRHAVDIDMRAGVIPGTATGEYAE